MLSTSTALAWVRQNECETWETRNAAPRTERLLLLGHEAGEEAVLRVAAAAAAAAAAAIAAAAASIHSFS